MYDEYNWCTNKDAADATGRSVRTIYRWVKKYGVTAELNPGYGFRIRRRGSKVIHKPDFLRWISEGMTGEDD